MSKVIQIRDVPDDVRDALADEARARGMSLTRYVRSELEHLARRNRIARDNAAIVRETRASVGSGASRDEILSILDEGRRP